ncbi:type VI secretion system baseplate subunit TssF [Eudoraea adriatica]|uniref:type VI secretion system baseplate subunit TssF n=1 Tax=Eudoraea adriatica TaxID=446681 RepID=UPI0003A7B7C6|nr:type VI secretion system baseplate subunit TssF [Eudoraea adriatica]
MIKNAADIWGVEANEIEMSFDPIVSLLLSACSAEIEKISVEMDESQTRITEKLIQLMTPEKIIGPRPAHAILYAEPVDNITTINPEYHFSYRKKIPYKKTSVKFKDLYFTPVQDFNLVDAKVKFIATGTNYIQLEEKKNRQILGKNYKNLILPPSTVYLGISSNLKTILIEDVSFYFELQGNEDKELFYHHLRNAEWFVNETKLDVISGFYNNNEDHKTDLKNIFEDVSNKSNSTCQQINNNYRRHYITIKAMANENGIKKSNFSELNDFLEGNKIKTDGEIRWIKIVFPRIISNKILGNLYCSLNTFPVLNRELLSFSYHLRNYTHIIPLKTEDLFFDLKSIVNTDGKMYKARSKNNTNTDKGTFIMRSDNVGKLDRRKAKEYIVYLVELLKDESASFSFLNNEFLLKNLKSLNQLIAVLEKKVAENINEETQTNYVVLKPHKTDEHLLVDFWTCNGVLANNIKSGSELNIYKGIGVKQTNSYLISTSHGGKDDLTMVDRLNSYRRSLLSRDRIVTKEDVRALCYEIYGEKIEKVEIKRAYTKDLNLNKGWIPCIEIVLTANNHYNTETEDWNSTNNNLLYQLEKKSINVFPYKIKILN